MSIMVAQEDAVVIRAVARCLRASGAEASELRVRYRTGAVEIKTGADLLAFLQASPLAEIDLDLRRN